MVSTESGFILEVRDGHKIVYASSLTEYRMLTDSMRLCKRKCCNRDLSEYWYEMILAVEDERGERIGRDADLEDGFYMVMFGYGSFGDKVYGKKKVHNGSWNPGEGGWT